MARYICADLDAEVKHESRLLEPVENNIGSCGISLCGVYVVDQIRLDYALGVGPVISTLPDCPFCTEINRGLL